MVDLVDFFHEWREVGLKSGHQLLSLRSSSSRLCLPDLQQDFYPQFLNREQHHVNKYGMDPRVLDNMCTGLTWTLDQ